MIFDLIHSILILKDSVVSFNKYCVGGLGVNERKVEEHVNHSLMLVTALAPKLGYDKCAKIAKLAYDEHCTLREATEKLGFLSGEEFDQIVIPEKMIGN